MRWFGNGEEEEKGLLLWESCQPNSSEQTRTTEVGLDGGNPLERWGMD